MKKYMTFEIDWALLWYDIKDFWKYKILREKRSTEWKWYGGYKK